jgi:signal transduction histidine kinase
VALHEFMTGNRAAVIASAVRKVTLAQPERAGDEVTDEISTFVDELIRTLRKDAGLSDTATLPGHAEFAARQGRLHFERGLDIVSVLHDFAMVCDSIAELGAAQHMFFEAREFQLLNQSIDAGTAAALEEYWRAAHTEGGARSTETFGYLAHELRNALATARLALETLQTGNVGANSRTGLLLQRSLARMDNLVGHALVMSRLESGTPLEPQTITLEPWLKQLVADAVTERGVSVTVRADADVTVLADERLLTSAIGNLIQNAIKFTAPDTTIEVRARAEGEHVIVEVEDRCGGLPSAEHEDLFLPFLQRGRDRRGAGLGLSIAAQSVKAHHGEIGVENLAGLGCIFRIKLPARALAEQELAAHG